LEEHHTHFFAIDLCEPITNDLFALPRQRNAIQRKIYGGQLQVHFSKTLSPSICVSK
jgi:hypothetical protein